MFYFLCVCVCCVEQISSPSSTSAPVHTGVKIPTCKFSMKEKFLTSPADLFRVFLNQEVSCSSYSTAPSLLGLDFIQDNIIIVNTDKKTHLVKQDRNKSSHKKFTILYLCRYCAFLLQIRLPDKNLFFPLQMVQAFTRAPATVDGQRGGKFRLLDGNIFGEFTELVRLQPVEGILSQDEICVCNRVKILSFRYPTRSLL